jgi:alpha-L-rhamnosidase
MRKGEKAVQDAVEWKGQWLTSSLPAPDGLTTIFAHRSLGAPWLRTVFECETVPPRARLRYAAPGWCEVYVNGTRVGEEVLAPVVTQLDRRVTWLERDVTALLRPGRNAVAVLLGNGWYNCATVCSWKFESAPWRSLPPLLLQIEDGEGRVLTATSPRTWKAAPSAVVMNSLRNGETQDLRLDVPGVSLPEFDDRGWAAAERTNPPPGRLVPEDCEQCVIGERLAPVSKRWCHAEFTLYDFGRNLTGWCELEADGPAGAVVRVQYGERVRFDGSLDTEQLQLRPQHRNGPFQTDQYILDGKGPRRLRPHFTYHGFQYVQIWTVGGAEVRRVEACFIHTGFREAGRFTCPGNPELDRLQQVIRHTFLCNFTGIPTDCPHREKNGWTGDANLAMEAGIWNYDTRRAIAHFTDLVMDAQRPSGQLPAIAPTGGWGYERYAGPPYDAVVFEAAWLLYRFHDDLRLAERHYDGFARWLDYCRWHEVDEGIVDFGLGDWAPYDERQAPPVACTSTAFYYQCAARMARLAAALGRPGAEYRRWRALASRIHAGFRRAFMRPDGDCANGSLTALGCAIGCGLAAPRSKTVKLLRRRVRAAQWRAEFGIYGAKYVPRALAEAGFLEDVLRLFTQPEFPGWGHWLKLGATTLWEHWIGDASLNHIMFGDPSACLYRYFAGIQPAYRGFQSFILKPALRVRGFGDFDCTYHSDYGPIRSARLDGEYICSVPRHAEALLVLPDGTRTLKPGEHRFQI